MIRWPHDAESLDAEQRRLGAATPSPWTPSSATLRIAGVFLAFARGQQGPGHAGDRGWVGAAIVEAPGGQPVEQVVVECTARAPYDPGRLALREGPALADALVRLTSRLDVALVDATGRDHPRRAGLALHLGALLNLPTVGVTHRSLVACGDWPPDETGASSPLLLDGEVVGAWLRTAAGTRPVAVHAAWRTDPLVAVEVVRRCCCGPRTPEPLRRARVLARTRRAHDEGRATSA